MTVGRYVTTPVETLILRDGRGAVASAKQAQEKTLEISRWTSPVMSSYPFLGQQEFSQVLERNQAQGEMSSRPTMEFPVNLNI